MKPITSFHQWLEVSQKEKALLLFVKTTNCSVCEGLYPQVEAIRSSIPFYVVNVSEVPEMAGQLSLFTAPVVLLWSNNKEYARFARFVSLKEVSKLLQELEDMENYND